MSDKSVEAQSADSGLSPEKFLEAQMPSTESQQTLPTCLLIQAPGCGTM